MPNTSRDIHQLTDHLFRHEAGKMVSVLTKIFGTENLETAEDVVQQTFIDSIQVWKLKGIPENPSAWLFRVAKNKAIDVLRRNKHSKSYDFSDSSRKLLTSEYTLSSTVESLFREELIEDDLLRMMFACCHPEISAENQITLILKTLCGFSTAEIAKAFLTSEDNVSKRLHRTKTFFREQKIKLEIPSAHELKERTHSVLNSIYLLFNEGYNSTHSDDLIRRDLIEDAMMLCKLLTENEHTQLPETFALMALMCFHTSRFEGRLTSDGEIILLPDQDRSKWDLSLILQGTGYMNQAAFGNEISNFHLEAAISFEHCSAQRFEDTNWQRILSLYDWICQKSPSPVAALNRTVAVLMVEGAEKALMVIENIPDKKKLESYYLYHSLLAEIHSQLNHRELSLNCYENALALTQSEPERKLLRDKIALFQT